MGLQVVRWLLFPAACVGCAGSAAPPPEFVSVEFRSAIVAPTKFGGAPWDGFGPPKPGAGQVIGRALSMANAHAAVLDVLGGPLMEGLEKPEPFGEAVVMVAGEPTERIALQTNVRDTLTPAWDGAVLAGVPLRESTVIEVRLYDRDLSQHDAIGDCNVRYVDLVEALRAGDVHQVQVAEQTARQLLFLGISVYAGG